MSDTAINPEALALAKQCAPLNLISYDTEALTVDQIAEFDEYWDAGVSLVGPEPFWRLVNSETQALRQAPNGKGAAQE